MTGEDISPPLVTPKWRGMETFSQRGSQSIFNFYWNLVNKKRDFHGKTHNLPGQNFVDQ